MLKADFHLHTNQDPEDTFITHSNIDLVKSLAKKGFDVFSITNHNKVTEDKNIRRYAKKHCMVFIPGAEFTVEGCHVLVLNPGNFRGALSFRKLERMKNNGSVIIAPHPFYARSNSLFEKLEENIHVFDAVEYCHFYTKFFTRNKPAIEIAEKYKKPLLANSDAHFLFQIGRHFTRLDCNKTMSSALDAIRKGKVQIETKPLTLKEALRSLWHMHPTTKEKLNLIRNIYKK